MPSIFTCVNYDTCRNYVQKPFTLCDECKDAARKLQREIQIEDRDQYIPKNEGLRRHPKAWWKR